MQIEIRHSNGETTHVVHPGPRISSASLAHLVDIIVNNIIPFASSGPGLTQSTRNFVNNIIPFASSGPELAPDMK
jgi:fructose-1-phosphate kinase PfkB-like protein